MGCTYRRPFEVVVTKITLVLSIADFVFDLDRGPNKTQLLANYILSLMSIVFCPNAS